MSSILNLAGVSITILFGLWALLQPNKFSKILSLTPYKERGITEIRATYGGWILGLSIYAAINQSQVLFICLGFGWLGAGLVRCFSMLFIDKSYSSINLQFVAIELLVSFLLFL